MQKGIRVNVHNTACIGLGRVVPLMEADAPILKRLLIPATLIFCQTSYSMSGIVDKAFKTFATLQGTSHNATESSGNICQHLNEFEFILSRRAGWIIGRCRYIG